MRLPHPGTPSSVECDDDDDDEEEEEDDDDDDKEDDEDFHYDEEEGDENTILFSDIGRVRLQCSNHH